MVKCIEAHRASFANATCQYVQVERQEDNCAYRKLKFDKNFKFAWNMQIENIEYIHDNVEVATKVELPLTQRNN